MSSIRSLARDRIFDHAEGRTNGMFLLYVQLEVYNSWLGGRDAELDANQLDPDV